MSSPAGVNREHTTELRSSVRLDVIEGIAPQLLVALLEPYAAFLSSRGVELSDHKRGRSFLAAIYEVLNADDVQIPMELRRTIVDITAMSTDLGFEALVDAAAEHGELLFGARHLTSHDLATQSYLSARHVFETARGRVRCHQAPRFTEYFPSTPAPIQARQLRARLPSLKAELRQHFASRTGSDYCRLLVATKRHDHVVLVCHAGRPLASPCITPGRRRRMTHGWLEVRDVVLLDQHTGRIALSAQSPADRECYRELFGKVMFEDGQRYRITPVYTGAPLIEQGASALCTDGVDGLTQVDVQEVRVRRADAREDRSWSHPTKAFFASSDWRRAKVSSQVTYLRLAFHLADSAYPAEIELVPPNTIAFDRRFVAHQAYTFLPRRGFMLRPTGLSSSPGA